MAFHQGDHAGFGVLGRPRRLRLVGDCHLNLIRDFLLRPLLSVHARFVAMSSLKGAFLRRHGWIDVSVDCDSVNAFHLANRLIL